MHRKTAPRVRGGRVQKKNNWTPALTDYKRCPRSEPVIDRRRPGDGYRHLLTCGDVREFISLLPGWDELAVGLHAVVLAPGRYDVFGWHVPGVVAVCAWDHDLWTSHMPSFVTDNAAILERLGVQAKRNRGEVVCKWTAKSARAFQLLDVFLHELGHHHDHMTTRSRRDAARGEPYAEAYARRHAGVIWESYLARFGL